MRSPRSLLFALVPAALLFACGGPTNTTSDAGNDAGATGTDAGAVDSGQRDGGSTDAGASDAGDVDAGEVDAGEVDAGELDAGGLDAGAADAGVADAGQPDAGPACTPADPLNGAPVVAPDDTWTWVDVPGATCRNGTATGFGVRIHRASSQLLVFLGTTGICFNGLSCTASPASFGSTQFDAWKTSAGTSGIFDGTDPANPLRDWNVVYVPGCTGDGHAGVNSGVNVPGSSAPQSQAFVGFTNLGLTLSRVVPTFPQVSQVLLAGSGLGVLLNANRVSRDFCGVPVAVLSDSFPVLSDTYLAPCLQQRWRSLWGFDATLASWCPTAIGPNGGNLSAVHGCLSTPHVAVLSSTQDTASAYIYGTGQNNCTAIDGVTSPFPGSAFAAGLAELRATLQTSSAPRSTYFVSGTARLFLEDGAFTTTSVVNVTLPDWVQNVVDGGTGLHVGP